MMDPQVHLGIKELWAIAWMGAYLKSVLPNWISSGTIRKRVPPGQDKWVLESPRVLDLVAVSDLPPEPYFVMTPDIMVEITKHRFQIDIGSGMDGFYSVGLGTAILYSATEGILLYWVAKEPLLCRRRNV